MSISILTPALAALVVVGFLIALGFAIYLIVKPAGKHDPE